MEVGKYNGYDYQVKDDDGFDLDKENASGLTAEEVEVLEQEMQREKKRLRLTLELMAKQASLKLVRGGNWTKKTRMQINESIKGLKEKVEVYEKNYILSRDVKESAIKGYKDSLKKITIVHTIQQKNKLIEIDNYEVEQQEAMNEKSALILEKKRMPYSKAYKKYLRNVQNVKDEIALAIKENDPQKASIKSKELKDLYEKDPIIRCDKEIEKAENTIKEMEEKIFNAREFLKKLNEKKDKDFKEIVEERETALSVTKQNFWQKLVGLIVNKFHKAGKVTNSVFEKLGKLDAQLREKSKEIIEEYDKQQQENDKVRADRAQARAKVKADQKEERRKRNAAITKNIENRIKEMEKLIADERGLGAQYNVKNMTPVFEGGNGTGVPFDGRD